VTNALAYYGVDFTSAVKSFMKETPERKLLLIRNFFFRKKTAKRGIEIEPSPFREKTRIANYLIAF